jgi:carbohydrate kinase (thermoresistant glucokinase family)
MLVVVMGVAGVGKTTVGELVADQLELPFHDADDFHSEANRRKMAAGVPLTEKDREPWLRDLARRMRAWEAEGGAVVACSALRRRHRDLLARAGPVRFVWLDAEEETIRSRLASRKGHYMPPELLDSQLATLEPPGPDEAVRVEAVGNPAETADAIVSALRGLRSVFPAA